MLNVYINEKGNIPFLSDEILNDTIDMVEKVNQDSLSFVENLKYENTIQLLKMTRYNRLK